MRSSWELRSCSCTCLQWRDVATNCIESGWEVIHTSKRQTSLSGTNIVTGSDDSPVSLCAVCRAVCPRSSVRKLDVTLILQRSDFDVMIETLMPACYAMQRMGSKVGLLRQSV